MTRVMTRVMTRAMTRAAIIIITKPTIRVTKVIKMQTN